MPTVSRRAPFVVRLLASLVIVGLVTAAYVWGPDVNPTTIALTYLVAILLIATEWGIAEATATSVLAMLCFDFFFLPPVGTFTLSEPQDLVAVIVFLLTATVASQLSGRARRRSVEAEARQRDLERLYALSRGLLLAPRAASLPGGIARQIADAFELQAVGVYDQRTDTASWAGARERHDLDPQLRETARQGTSVSGPSGTLMTAVELGGAPTGSVALLDAGLTETVGRSIANLVAIGLERGRVVEATARADAARESSELRATMLDALAHEFKTPLTSLKAASSELLVSLSGNARDGELVSIVDEELDRLGSLVTDAVQMVRVDAGDFTVHIERQSLASIVEATLEGFERRLDGHAVASRVPADLEVGADGELLGLAMRQLVDNALKYSPHAAVIEITATMNEMVDIGVRNSGSLIPEREQQRIFERFYRGAHSRHIPGTGLGLAIVEQVARAHGGSLAVSSTPEGGTTFTLSIPRTGATS